MSPKRPEPNRHELEEKIKRLETIIDHSAAAIMFADNQERLISWNRFTERLLGMNEEDLKLKPIRSLYPKEEWDRIRSMNIRSKGIQEHLETRMIKKNGLEIEVDISISVIRDDKNNITGSIGIIRDITERKEAERELQASEERFRTIFENSAMAMMVADAKERLLSWNPAVEKLLGMTGQDLMLKPIHSFYPKEEWRRIREMDIRERGVQEHLETKMIKKNGQTIDVDVSISVLRDSHQSILGSIGIIRDITERKQAERERQAKEAALAVARSKTEFFANMSHEMRTPLNGILGMIDLMKGTTLNQEQQEYLSAALMSAETLYSVINDILDFSKMEAGKLTLERIPFNLRETVSDAINIPALRAHAKGLELVCHVYSDVPEKVVGDPYRLRQVILNLVSNAIKFTEKGEVVVEVKMKSKTKDKTSLQFSIVDTGIGIDEEKQKIIFKPFFQADYSTTRKYGGTGLGLSIATQLVRAMNGKIEIESPTSFYPNSKPHAGGPGTTFHFELEFEPAKSVKASQAVVNAKQHLHGMPILIVDDNETCLNVFADMLRGVGMRPICAQSAQAAIQSLKELKGKGSLFAFIDAEMPNRDGVKIVEWLRQSPQFSGTKIVMMHALGQLRDAAYLWKLGISANLPKPIRQSALLEAFIDILNNKPIPVKNPEPESKPQKALRVLLVEDNEVNQKVAEGLIKRQRHTLRIAGNGKEALAILEKESFDVVLMDIQLPEMDGFETTKFIREREAKTGEHLRIIALTAHALKGDRERCLEAGMDGYLTKPLRTEDLYAAITSSAPEIERSSAAAQSTEQKLALVNWTSGLRYVAGDENLLRQVFNVFIEDVPIRIERMKDALQSQEFETLRQEAHTLKGSASTVGAESLSATALRLEQAAQHQDAKDAKTFLGDFEEIFSDLLDFWQESEQRFQSQGKSHGKLKKNFAG